MILKLCSAPSEIFNLEPYTLKSHGSLVAMRAVINDAAEIFTLINTFTVVSQRQDAVVKSLRDFTEQHARFLAGFIGASVHASLNRHRVVNYVQWESEADLVAMMASAPAKAHIAEVGALAEHVDPVVYRVAFVGSRERAAQ